MGKYMRKGKGVGKMEVSQGTLVGVRTRARALAMEKEKIVGNLYNLTASSNTANSSKASESSCHAFNPNQPLYMELRSRRLEKGVRSENEKEIAETYDPPQASARDKDGSSGFFLPVSAELHSFDEERGRFWIQTGSCSVQGSDSTSHSRLLPISSSLRKPLAPTASSTHSSAVSISQKKALGILTRNRRQELARSAGLLMNSRSPVEMDATLVSLQQADPCSKKDIHMDVELCFGESPMVAGISSKERECEPLSTRGMRECTPDSLIRDMEAPGSTSRTRPSSQARPLSAPVLARCIQSPTCNEIEAFFSSAEQRERRRFINRFNFDPLLERPMRGRYEWFNI